jgi:hypothetical protein
MGADFALISMVGSLWVVIFYVIRYLFTCGKHKTSKIFMEDYELKLVQLNKKSVIYWPGPLEKFIDLVETTIILHNQFRSIPVFVRKVEHFNDISALYDLEEYYENIIKNTGKGIVAVTIELR